ncbi:hypothetical protein M413DRAFT_440945 [Hebeloma cylindrosporum]|uniref:DUF1742-domain-containing protein n=1 Tax=Hebeloma cylindrosporum TaxID=76867 RepID=A0A0C2Y7Q2_HEBCY|nr:hypothetical protein M413DRAFT_440945 [Hebeloma cylindrosporum h7]
MRGQTAGTAKACYVCYKPTTTVLATVNTVDFLYTCLGHLSDSGFATIVQEAPKSSAAVSAEEIAKVKAEWQEKQKKKQEREQVLEKEKEKEEEDANSKSRQKKEELKVPNPPGSLSVSPSTTPQPTHDRYILHRDFFAMRQSEHRRRRQATQARELAPRLPGAPNGGVS